MVLTLRVLPLRLQIFITPTVPVPRLVPAPVLGNVVVPTGVVPVVLLMRIQMPMALCGAVLMGLLAFGVHANGRGGVGPLITPVVMGIAVSPTIRLTVSRQYAGMC